MKQIGNFNQSCFHFVEVIEDFMKENCIMTDEIVLVSSTNGFKNKLDLSLKETQTVALMRHLLISHPARAKILQRLD